MNSGRENRTALAVYYLMHPQQRPPVVEGLCEEVQGGYASVAVVLPPYALYLHVNNIERHSVKTFEHFLLKVIHPYGGNGFG